MSTLLNHIIGGAGPNLPELTDVSTVAGGNRTEIPEATGPGQVGLRELFWELLSGENRLVAVTLCFVLGAGLLSRGAVEVVQWVSWRRTTQRIAAGLRGTTAFAAAGAAGTARALPAGGWTGAPSLAVPGGAALQEIVVHVAGAVLHPGVYHLEPGSRVDDALKAAGGSAEGAAAASLNLAEPLSDGSRIYVPTRAEAAESGGTPGGYAGPVAAAGVPSAGVSALNGRSGGGKVNINTATAQTLEELPGVGPSTAARIIAYRQQYGSFKVAEDLKNVPGIGEKKYAELAPFIAVR